MVQESILPPWTMRALLLLLGVLVALVLLWFLLLKPAIQSTASRARRTPLRQAGITPPPGGFKPARQSRRRWRSGSSPAPGASSSPGTVTNVGSAPPLTGGGAPTDGRLVFGQASLQVPSGKTVFRH